ncbi:MAG: recombinase family protein [Rhizobiales bacterium]|nr:recombinase family protein [Hyphomicrobiales bacterium]
MTLRRPRAYSYVRFSTPEQARGDSYRRQTELSRAFAAQNGLDLDETLTFQDLGVSAFRGRNAAEGALGAFIEAVDMGRISRGSYLLVESLDRLSRETVTRAFTQMTALLEKGVNVATLQDGKTFTSETFSQNFGDLMVSLSIMFRAHEESQTKGKRVGAAWANKRESARMRGHKLTAICPAWLKLDASRTAFEVIDERAEVVRRIFALTLDGVGKGRIAAMFNEEAVATFGNSAGWQSSYVQKILESEAVTGVFQPMRMVRDGGKRAREPDGEPIAGYFPPIVSREEFLAARAQRAERRIGSGKKGQTLSNLLTGIGRCGLCGSAMHFINKGLHEHYLVCSGARRKASNCGARSWRYGPVERFLLLTLREVDYRELFPSVAQSVGDNIKSLDADLLTAEDDLEQVSARVERAVSLLIERPDSSALKTRLDALELDRDRLRDKVGELTQRLAAERDRLSSVEHEQEDIREALERLAAAHGIDTPAELFLIRSRLHQLLKRTLSAVIFRPSMAAGEHGEITVEFAGASSYARRLRVFDGQKEALAAKIINGAPREEVSIRVS